MQGLPEKAQKGELEGPETISGESPFVGLRETMCWNPRGAKQLELMQGRAGELGQTLSIAFKIVGPIPEERSFHGTVYTLSNI